NSIQELIANHSHTILQFIQAIENNNADFAYAENKWTVKQVLQHMIDTERVFVYRILSFSRKDATPLPGFDENTYAANADVQHRTLDELKEEFSLLRKSSDIFFASLQTEQLEAIGIANNNSITVNALCYIVFGHALHHIEILKERYFKI
ncbi:MAG TPA: DinB family protein, partial [Chitinophagaceae bacterium]|nr:DinB family protein [Chitinophagaceae bacterium]